MISKKHILNRVENQIKKHNLADKAAVLIPIIEDNDGRLSLLFEVRSSSLRSQPGDICFPGGKMDITDHSPSDTAIRETHEELGITKNSIKIYGELPSFYSAIGFKIYPIVGELTSTQFSLNQAEVSHTFCVPLDWFINTTPIKATIEAAHRPADDFPFALLPQKSKDWQKRSQHEVYIYQYQGYVIWGLTAQIIQQFIKTVC